MSGNPSRGIYRTHAQTRILKDEVLDGWASGLNCPQLATRHQLAVSYVEKIVQRARADGDARAAARRKAINRMQGCGVTLKHAVLALDGSGMDGAAIASILGVTKNRVREVIWHAKHD